MITFTISLAITSIFTNFFSTFIYCLSFILNLLSSVIYFLLFPLSKGPFFYFSFVKFLSFFLLPRFALAFSLSAFHLTFLTWICFTRGGYRIPRSYTSALHLTHRISYILLLTPYALHLTPYTLHLTPYTLHLTPYVLHLTFYTLRLTSYILHLTPYVFRLTSHILYHIVSYSVPCDMYTFCV
jgi:hypothetical protein